MDRDFLKTMAQKIYINPSEEVLNSLASEYDFLKKNLEELKKINVDNIDPLVRIALPINFEHLRNDEIDKDIYLEKEILLENAKDKNEDFVVMKRIIK